MTVAKRERSEEREVRRTAGRLATPLVARMSLIAAAALIVTTALISPSVAADERSSAAANRVDSVGAPAAAHDRLAEHAGLVAEIESALARGAARPALELADRALALAQSIGNPLRVGATRSLHAQLLVATGELEKADAEFETAAGELAASPALLDANRMNQANLAARLGRFTQADATYRAVAKRARAR